MHGNIGHLFNNFPFEKNGKEIADKALIRVHGLENKVKEREERIERIRKDYDISDKALIEALSQQQGQQYSTKMLNTVVGEGTDAPKVIPAGVIQNIQTEKELIREEQEQIKRLSLLSRNLEEGKLYKLTFAELELLEF